MIPWHDAPGQSTTAAVTSAHLEFARVVGRDGSVEVTYELRDKFLAAAALLKYSCLATCLWLQDVPRSKSADEVRAFLLAIRDGHIDEARLQVSVVERFGPSCGWRMLTPLARSPYCSRPARRPIGYSHLPGGSPFDGR